jgi:hypothetical protein
MNIKKTLLQSTLIIATIFFMNILHTIQEDEKPISSSLIDTISSDDQLKNLLENNKGFSVLFFHMDGCQWCEKMQVILNNVIEHQKFKKIKFYSMQVTTPKTIAIVKNTIHKTISTFPTIFFMNNKKIIDKQIGFEDQKSFEKKITKNIKKNKILSKINLNLSN